MTDAYSMQQYIQDHVELADKCLAEHVIRAREPGKRIMIGKPDRSEYRCSLILEGPYLIMVGDLDTMVWAFCPYKAVEQAIGWMSGRDVDYYVKQKAQIGMGQVGCESFVQEVALHEARESGRLRARCFQ